MLSFAKIFKALSAFLCIYLSSVCKKQTQFSDAVLVERNAQIWNEPFYHEFQDRAFPSCQKALATTDVTGWFFLYKNCR